MYLQCPECRLTVSVRHFLRGHCPRCRTVMEPRETVRAEPAPVPVVAPKARMA